MGYSRDKLPLPGAEGLFAAVAFHGHGKCHLDLQAELQGMSRILCCTRALATQMNDPQLRWDKRLPISFEISTSRIKRALDAPPIYAKDPNRAGLGLPMK
jgi:hypothetical protein